MSLGAVVGVVVAVGFAAVDDDDNFIVEPPVDTAAAETAAASSFDESFLAVNLSGEADELSLELLWKPPHPPPGLALIRST